MKNRLKIKKSTEKIDGPVVPFIKWVPSLVLVSFVTVFFMAFLVFYLNWNYKDIQAWQLMLLIILSASFAAPAGAYAVFRRMDVLYQKILHELERREHTEQQLRIARDGLEERVNERTLELQKVNQKLENELVQRIKAQNELKLSLEEKEMLVKEIHHRVKNNLQVISSLLSLQSRYIKDDEDLEMFKESQNRAKSMALIHEKLYQSSNLRQINFKEYLEMLCNELFASYSTQSHLNLVTEIENIELDVNQAIPCGLIVNEIMANSLKYAFPDHRSGSIKVYMHRKEDHIILKIADDGVGVGKDFTLDDVEHNSSLGLKLVKTLTTQLNGVVELDKTMGTAFIIKFKENSLSKN